MRRNGETDGTPLRQGAGPRVENPARRRRAHNQGDRRHGDAPWRFRFLLHRGEATTPRSSPTDTIKNTINVLAKATSRRRDRTVRARAGRTFLETLRTGPRNRDRNFRTRLESNGDQWPARIRIRFARATKRESSRASSATEMRRRCSPAFANLVILKSTGSGFRKLSKGRVHHFTGNGRSHSGHFIQRDLDLCESARQL